MDENQIEIADEIAEAEREIGLKNAREALAPQFDESFDGETCVDCPEKLPANRIADGRIRCTVCQSIVEKKKKRGW